MSDTGLLTIYSLNNIATAGSMPTEKLVSICTAYFLEQRVGVTRAYAAMSANQKIDRLVRCFNVQLPNNAEYVVIDGEQYRISLKQKVGDSVDLTLERMEDYLDVTE